MAQRRVLQQDHACFRQLPPEPQDALGQLAGSPSTELVQAAEEFLGKPHLEIDALREMILGLLGGSECLDRYWPCTRQCRCESDHDRSTRPRAVAPEMAQAWTALVADARVTQWIGGGEPWERERSEQRFDWMLDHWRRHGFGWRSALHRESGAWVGFVGLNYVTPDAVELDEGEVEIGLWLQPEVWGQGLATEGALATRDEAFQRLNLARIVGRLLATPPRDDHAEDRHDLPSRSHRRPR